MKTLTKTINKNEIKITKMSNNEGNELLSNLVKNVVDLTLKNTKRKKIVDKLKNGLEQINKNHTDVYDHDVRNEMFYFIDNAFNLIGYDEIDIDELF